jgi:hypothetical protein
MSSVVVVVVEVDVDVEVVVVFGAGAPGVSICPAKTETAKIRLSIAVALIRRKVFTFRCLPREMKKFFINVDQCEFSCKSAAYCVRFAV